MQQNYLSGAPNVYEARSALGKRLRELRTSAGITGRALAESLSWQPSKVSKLENGRQTPTDEDIRGWTRITGSGSETETLLSSLHTLETQYADWQRQLRGGLRPHQYQLAQIDAKTRLFRVFDPATIPGLLQTSEYARARFAEGVVLFNMPDDIDYAVRTRMERQELLYQREKHFHFVITEAALRYRRSSLEAQLAQLDRLMSLSALPNVKLGIIGFEAQYIVGPWHAFWLRDQERVTVETFSAELNLTQPQEIELYAHVFERMASAASYGRLARGIITRVIDDLAPEPGDANSEFPEPDGTHLVASNIEQLPLLGRIAGFTLLDERARPIQAAERNQRDHCRPSGHLLHPRRRWKHASKSTARQASRI